MNEAKREQPEGVSVPIIMDNDSIYYPQASALQRTPEDDEQEWENLFTASHARRGLRRIAVEVRQQFIAGETEEGGFAVE